MLLAFCLFFVHLFVRFRFTSVQFCSFGCFPFLLLPSPQSLKAALKAAQVCGDPSPPRQILSVRGVPVVSVVQV